MKSNLVIKQILKPAIVIYLIVAIIFAIISFKYLELLLGWLYGGFAAMITFVVGAYLIKSIKLNKSKKMVFWLGFLRTWGILAIHAGLLFLLILVNTKVNNVEFFRGGIKALKSPISFFSYLGGIMLITISALMQVFIKKGDRRAAV